MSDQVQKTRRGVKWSVIDQVVRQLVTLVISGVLSRLLTPAEFGLLGMVTVAIGFLQVLKDIGLGSSIIQKQGITSEEQSTIFWLNLILGAVMAVVLVIIAPFIAAFFDEPQLTLLIRVMSINFIISSMAIVPDALIMKAIDFKSYFFRNFGTTVLGGVLGILMAFKGYGVWALIGQSLLTTTAGLFISFGMIKWRPQFIFKIGLLKSHLRYSAPLLADSSINYWVRNIDNLLVGKYLGAVQLGIYTRAYNLMLLPIRQISSTLSRVMFPSFSLIQHDKEKMWEQYCKMMSLVAMISFPVMVLLGVYAREAILIVYGHQWMEVVPIFKILCFLGAAQSIATIAGPVYYSTGKTALLFRVGLVTKTIMIAGIVGGLIYGGLIGMVWGYTFTSMGAFMIEAHYVSRVLNHNLIQYLKIILPESMAALCCLGILATAYYFRSSSGDTISFGFIAFHLLMAVIAVTVYIVVLFKLKSRGFAVLRNSLYAKKKTVSPSHDG